MAMTDIGAPRLAETLPATTNGLLIIDLDRIAANWRSLAAFAAPAACAAVVKADAYGLGADRVIPVLWQAGCRTFFVATFDEAVQAKHLCPEAVVYVLNGVMTSSEAEFLSLGIRPVLSSVSQLERWARACADRRERVPAALHVDTGLNRLGIPHTEFLVASQRPELMSRIDVALVMSHLACADDPTHPMNDGQRLRFEIARRLWPATAASLAASDGMLLGQPYHYDMVRPGYALYGGQASIAAAAPVNPVVRVRVKVLAVEDVPAGATVGYSATWRASVPSRIATLAAGYADGLPRGASGPDDGSGGVVSIAGVHCPITGRVSMDLTTVEVTAAAAVRPGDWADIIGPDLTIEEVGRRAGTIGYEILTRLGRRFHRSYVGGA